MKNTNSQVLSKTFAVRFTLVRFILARFTLARFVLAAILIPALLIGSAFTFGVSNLQAQEVQSSPNGSSKQGFFAGFVYLSGFKVDTTTLVTTNSTTYTDAITTGYEITGYGDATSSIVVTGVNPTWNPKTTAAGIRALLKANCERGETSVDIAEDGDATEEYFFNESSNAFTSFTIGEKPELNEIEPSGDATVTLPTSAEPFPTGFTTGETSHCFRYFFGDLSSTRTSIDLPAYEIATADSEPTPTAVIVAPRTITSSKSDKISGIGLQFGFRWEKWRASLTHFTGKGGDNELANTLVMADYFVNKDFFVGGGLASMTLTNGLTSGSATSPALRVGYKRNLTSNLSLNFGLTKYISGVSLKSSATTTNTTANANTTPMVLRSFEETQTSKAGDSATIGAINVRIPGFRTTTSGRIKGLITRFRYVDERIEQCPNCPHSDQRIQVTQFRSRTVNIDEIQIPAGATETQTTTTTETDAELKAPLVISISLHLSF